MFSIRTTNKPLKIILRCPLKVVTLDHPVIIGTGKTFSENELRNWIRLKNQPVLACPESGNDFDTKRIIQNKAIARVISLYETNKNSEYLRHLLRIKLKCPLSMELFDDPVVAEDGETYERSNISVYIKKHGKTPTGVKTTANRLIENFIMKSVIDFVKPTQNEENLLEYPSETEASKYFEKIITDVKTLKGKVTGSMFGAGVRLQFQENEKPAVIPQSAYEIYIIALSVKKGERSWQDAIVAIHDKLLVSQKGLNLLRKTAAKQTYKSWAEEISSPTGLFFDLIARMKLEGSEHRSTNHK